MFATMLFAFSIVALAQFGLYYWRAVLSTVAAQPVSDRVLAAARVENGRVAPVHFETLAGLHDLTPDLFPNRGGLALVRLYYSAVEGLDALAGALASRVPEARGANDSSIAAWALVHGLAQLLLEGRIARAARNGRSEAQFVSDVLASVRFAAGAAHSA